ncbi:Uncharacterised protein [Campylobacter hyointestinalis subsp. hyointestinalis]|uniref:Helix-turn-helix domain-containing protein n=1 Tax=Campylobacter hyointestinalis subsp. hyointestinalis TaxID=91352 RepID=A0A9W5EUX9_CAMHY|nr:hypothetical protein [Campylobacter hyointestinalis]CUU81701.1 Uncharacterised protein [Campylobacter hyointestinalis subsp. hyointestinalis]
MSIITKTLKSNGYFVINKHLMRVLGLNKAIILSLFIDKADYYDNQMFFYTIEDISEALGGGLSEREIRATIKSLIDENLLIDKGMIGIPAKRFFLINEIKISELFDRARDSKKDINSPCENKSPSPCKNDRANIINPHITNPNNINPNIQKEKNVKKENPQELEAKNEQNEAFKNLNLEAFSKWVKYCEQKNFKIVGIQFDELKKYLCKFDKNKQEQIINYSIANGYKGLYEPKIEQSPKSQMSDEELDKFFAMQKNDDPVLSNNWLSKGLPQEVKSFNQHLDSGAIPEDFKQKFLIGE